ncbi:TetR family transcriptional regulator [Sporichthya brevicatena]|uniref:TetR family transcriptional regulator n=1 Tax=Sporichthya brevicatena TaxID=171442 RepID=A0ABP3REH8_9ACTN
MRRSRVRRDLAHCAVTLMTEKGFDATTVAEIASAADYHPSSFFRYFATKEEAVFLGVPEATEEFRAACAGVRRGDDAWPVVRDAVVAAVANFTEADPDFFAAQFALWLTDPALQGPMATNLLKWEEIIAATFATAGGRKQADLYCHVVGGAIVSSLRACVYAHGQERDSFTDRVARAIALLEQGLRRPGGRQAGAGTLAVAEKTMSSATSARREARRSPR